MDLKALIQKYSTAGPRYTSYPTAPHFTESLGEDAYRRQLAEKSGDPKKPLALYAHIPFCEALCYYCGCNILITKDHGREKDYVDSLLKEISTVAGLLGTRRALSQISWGGGTPTFLSVDQMERLQKGTVEHFDLAPGAEVSIEVDPRVTSLAQLERLRELGFNRVSMGVQDFHPEVQQAVNRVQTVDMTAGMLEDCRRLGYRGINFDFIYGLPFQTLGRFEKTVDEILRLKPDRIALYNYAHLPSVRPHQKILEKYPMPGPEERVEIFLMAYERLLAGGYRSIGMDHFALADDDLAKAIESGTLYRNFMGYTVQRAEDMLGIGASAIGEVGHGYFQNIREAKPYQEAIEAKGLSTLRGCQATEEDLRRKWTIQRLMCSFDLSFAEYAAKFGHSFEEHFASQLAQLAPFVEEGILEMPPGHILVTDLGRLFIRNVAMLFDEYLTRPGTATYSRTV